MKEELISLLITINPNINNDDRNFIANDGDLINKGFIDSISLIEFASLLEEKFQINLEPDDMIIENFQNIINIQSLLLKKKAV